MPRKRKNAAPNITGAEAALNGGEPAGATAREHNAKVRIDAIKSSFERMYEIDREIAELIGSSGIRDLRTERSDIKKRLREDYNMPSKLVNARYTGYRIERAAEDGADDVTLDAIHEMYRALPVGGTGDFGDAAGWPRESQPTTDLREDDGESVDAKVARAAGRQAGQAGKAAIENPHPAGSDKHSAWIAGWHEAQAERAGEMGPGGSAPPPDPSERRPGGRAGTQTTH